MRVHRKAATQEGAVSVIADEDSASALRDVLGADDQDVSHTTASYAAFAQVLSGVPLPCVNDLTDRPLPAVE